jgi:hypothetical protein
VRRRTLLLILLAAAFALPAAGASAYPAPIPSYNNHVPPVLEDGQETLPATAGGGTAAASKKCKSAKRSVKKAKRKIKSLKRKLKKSHSRARRRKLRRSLRKWRKKLKRGKKRSRKYCKKGKPNTSAPVDYPGLHRAGSASCVPLSPYHGGYVSLDQNPTMRSPSPNYVQYVAYTTSLFRLVGGRWVFQEAYGPYFWTIASYYGELGWVGPNNESEQDTPQQFDVHSAGKYRIAVRYHWWANSQGGRAGTAWHWAGTHSMGYPAPGGKYCTFP